MMLLDDFVVRALVAGIGVALVAGPLGCFIVWRRMAFFGATMSHAALLGVSLAFLLNINVTLGIIGACAVTAIVLLSLTRLQVLPTDALLGLLAHAALALGLVAISFQERRARAWKATLRKESSTRRPTIPTARPESSRTRVR